ncbi:ankyrin repeat domain-containing protein [Rubidibacter lacunae]|uniref:ankyrin repeat domain-containing protein n=1 Tax=Rubidibacter lacunae TaxID=582514 RepID=UPI0005913581|nr:ankyrin repeat domain-containing protein [Rubidibacter lacunae]
MTTAFEQAIVANDLAAVSEFLQGGVAVNQKNPLGLTPLMVAAGRGYLQLLEILLTAGADVHVLDSRMGASALHKAAQRGIPDGARLLLEAGAFIDLRSAVLGHTPLMDAAWNKQPAMVALLLDRGANTALTTSYGGSLADFIGTSSGAPASSDSPAQEQVIARMRALVEDREARDRQRIAGNRLMAAVQARDLTTLHEALAEGDDVNQRLPSTGTPDDGTTPLLAASLAGETQLVEALLAAGADPHLVDRIMKATPGHKAAYRGHSAVLERLISAGLELDAQGPYNGYSALHDAVWHGHTATVKSLLAAGARPNLVAHNGKTPLDLAIEYGYLEIADLLRSAIDA